EEVKVNTPIARLSGGKGADHPSPPRGGAGGGGVSPPPEAPPTQTPRAAPSPTPPAPPPRAGSPPPPTPPPPRGRGVLGAPARPPPRTPDRGGGGGLWPDPEVPAGTKMVRITVRDALRDAIAEEMRRDPDVFLMGEEVAQYQGAYKVSRDLLQEFGDRRVID